MPVTPRAHSCLCSSSCSCSCSCSCSSSCSSSSSSSCSCSCSCSSSSWLGLAVLSLALALAGCGPETHGKSTAPSKWVPTVVVTPVQAEDAGARAVARPRGAPPAAADCERAVDKALALLPPPPRVPRREPDAGPRDPADRQRLLDECMRSTAQEVACVLAAEPTSEALLACFQWDEDPDAGVR